MSEAERLARLLEDITPFLDADLPALTKSAAELRRLSKIEADNEALRKDKAIVDFLIGEKMLFCWIDKDGDGSFTAVRAIGQVTVKGVESVDVRTAVAAAMAARPGGSNG